jgi:pimeloyl-ACP methyl ester carboxylesterase
MAKARIDGIEINYRVIGSSGPFVALMPGERRPHQELVDLATDIASRGCRVLLHDRRNTGASEVAISGESEHVVWADDLHGLIRHLGGLPFYVGGSSSGARAAITLALRHPEALQGLLLWRVTGGQHASEKLAKKYYGDPIDLARNGMAAVCDSHHFSDVIANRPANRDKLMSMAPAEFIAVMERWQREFLEAAALPVIGATEEQLQALSVPACILAGNDKVHSPATARRVAGLLASAELIEGVVSRRPEDDLLDEWDRAEWRSVEPEMARIFGDFMHRVESGAFAAA